ncbi:hypothetical protein EXIGLDRAFT_734708 [Exidia glandulosa HHB12029]|uniref:Distal membrane-arm assembly complex protein 1-like domain-containing protein n=1 Tax=Exidia glandulosa HHB12029 TaxID=1314781 RepID=A0A165B149_EXIGL|nr:hypothetical protein EXIGLDRAFT_734708 [Exidia glandulosa HHB12029]
MSATDNAGKHRSDSPADVQAQDCLECRFIGTAAFSGTGAYALYQSRRAAPGSPFGKRVTAVLGVALLCAGAGRWFN